MLPRRKPRRSDCPAQHHLLPRPLCNLWDVQQRICVHTIPGALLILTQRDGMRCRAAGGRFQVCSKTAAAAASGVGREEDGDVVGAVAAVLACVRGADVLELSVICGCAPFWIWSLSQHPIRVSLTSGVAPVNLSHIRDCFDRAGFA